MDDGDDLFLDSDENSEDLCSESSWETTSDYDENDDLEYYNYQKDKIIDNSTLLTDENDLKYEQDEAKQYY